MSKWLGRIAIFLSAGAILVGGTTWLLPVSSLRQWFTTLPIVAQSIAFPHIWLVGSLLLAFVFGLLTLGFVLFGARPREGSPAAQERRRRIWTTATVAVCWAVASVSPLLGITPLSARAVATGPVEEGWRLLNVLEWNVASQVHADEVRSLLRERVVDVAVLPEQDADRISIDGYKLFESTTAGKIAPVTVAVRNSLGSYRQVPINELTFGALLLEPDVGMAGERWLPRILAVHAAPPVPGLMGKWRADLEQIAALARYYRPSAKDPRPLVIVGDFNAANWHGALGDLDGYVDALEWLDPLRRGTWPSVVPGPTVFEGVMRTPIDHILLPAAAATDTLASPHDAAPGAVRVGHVELLRRPSSDHIAIYTMLQFKELTGSGAAVP
ncbi:MAG: endonuclease/exonuclease/phosphatase family protein [Buchananella hordeovulneris]|nr:endonuclease/exonuclease/phosphatase family protein [Buchananella hordeovulneris]